MCINTDVGGCCSYTGAVTLAHEGKVSRENMTRPQLLMARLMQPMPMIFITTPVFACRGHSGGGGGVGLCWHNESEWLFLSNWKKWRTHHVGHFEETGGKHNGIGWSGHWQHECEGGAEGAGDHHVQRIQADGLGLGWENNRVINFTHELASMAFFLLHFNTSCLDVS